MNAAVIIIIPWGGKKKTTNNIPQFISYGCEQFTFYALLALVLF